jgi:hypothetical protein
MPNFRPEYPHELWDGDAIVIDFDHVGRGLLAKAVPHGQLVG